MTNKEILEGNKLIAEFMINNNTLKTPTTEYSTEGMVKGINDLLFDDEDFEELSYHISFDWLIPVVEKISSINFPRIDINFRGLKFDSNKVYVCSNINYTYLGVIKFIKWYNENK